MTSLEDMRRQLREKYEFLRASSNSKTDVCKATEPCRAVTPYGTAEGKKSSLGNEVNRLVTVEDFDGIAKKGEIEPSRYTEVVSLSTCPTQTYGGKVRLVLDSEGIKDKLIPTCYIPFDTEVERGMEDEAHRLAKEGKEWTYNYVRAKYAISPDIYDAECQYEAREPISLKETLKRVEYWIGGIKPQDFNVGCERLHPHIAGPYSTAQDYLDHIQRAKRIAENLSVPFEVKSCFSKLRASWYTAIELNEENLRKFAAGEVPPSKPEKEIPEICRCS